MSKHNRLADSPDLNPLDFNFWSQSNVVRYQLSRLEELQQVVEGFATNFNPVKARAMTRHTRH